MCTVVGEDFLLSMEFDNLTFNASTTPGDYQCADITILDDTFFEKFQVIRVTVGTSYPEGIKYDDKPLKIKIIDDGKYQ